jgi:four helix bundle protein
MPYQSFESLEAWQRACRLAKAVYQAMGSSRDFGLKDQMTRAAVSIPSNIAEGYERGTNRDFIRFLKIAQGSAAELRTQAYIAHSVGEMAKRDMLHVVEDCKAIGAMLQALAKARANLAQEASLSELMDDLDDFDFPETGTPKPETH